MSASQDKSQKITFVYLDLYKLQKKMKEKEPEALKQELGSPTFSLPGKTSGQVLKAAQVSQNGVPDRVQPYVPASLIGKRVVPAAPRNEVVESLKENLKSLNQLHARLKFMLEELEELIKN